MGEAKVLDGPAAYTKGVMPSEAQNERSMFAPPRELPLPVPGECVVGLR
jgi:hypothetical protein